MSLVKTVAEVKAVLPKLVSQLNASSALPNFDTAELKYLVPVIGIGLYNDLQTRYDNNTLSQPQIKLMKHAQLLIVCNAFRDEMIINQVMWTDTGLRTMTTAELGKPVGWEFKELKEFFITRAADAEEVLLTYLWAEKASFPLWTASAEYKRFSALLIRTGTEFKQQYKSLYQPMRTYYQLQPVVEECQEKYLEEGVGRKLLMYLIALDGPSDEVAECIRLLKKALAYFTIKEACLQLPVRVSDTGLTVAAALTDSNNDDPRQQASAAMIADLRNNCETEGQNYLSKARYELWKYFRSGAAIAGFTAAYNSGPLTQYLSPDERTSGNRDRNFFVL